VRFVSIGLGRASLLYHVPGIRKIPGAELAGGFDLSPERRASWAQATGAPTYDSLDDLFKTARPDVALIGTPPSSHAELCVRAIEEGCHVFCEKPFVETAADADRVLDVATAARRVIAVNHQFREHPIFRAAREAVASGRYGRLVFCQLWQLVSEPPWNEPTPWRAGMANRTLLEGGVHLVDLLTTFFGQLPTAVQACRSAGFHEDRDADPIQLLTLEFPGNRLGQVTIDRLCPGGTRYIDLRADCERASVRASFGGRATVRVGMKRAERAGVRIELGPGGLAWAEQGVSRKLLARNPRNSPVLGTRRLLEGFAAAIAQDGEPPSSAREARNVLAVIDGAYESARTGAKVELDPALATGS
jgi:predicted dehydrogenase